MSIIITGLEMPTERESFRLTIKYNGTVLDTETGMQIAEAYELSPHGRCIDADTIKKQISHMNMEAYMDGVCYRIHPSLEYLDLLNEIIDDAPTIIPAETTLKNEIKIIDTKGKPNYDPKHRFAISAEENNNDR